MDLAEARALEARRPVLAFSPHALLAGQGREIVYAELLPGETLEACPSCSRSTAAACRARCGPG
jgi:hypothetical protein